MDEDKEADVDETGFVVVVEDDEGLVVVEDDEGLADDVVEEDEGNHSESPQSQYEPPDVVAEEVLLEEAGLGVVEDDEGLADDVVEEDECIHCKSPQSQYSPPDVLVVEEVPPEEEGLGADEVLEEDDEYGAVADDQLFQSHVMPPGVLEEDEELPEEAGLFDEAGVTDMLVSEDEDGVCTGADGVVMEDDDGASGLVDDVSLPEACGLSTEALSPELLSVLPLAEEVLSETSTGFVLSGVLVVSAGLVLSLLPVLSEPSGALTDEL